MEPGLQSGVTHLSGHADDIWSVAVHSDGRRIATGGRDGLIIVWDLDLQAPVHLVRAPTFGVRDLKFLEPRDELIATSGDGHVYLLDLGTSSEFRAKDLDRGQLYGVEWEPQQGRIYVATSEGLTVLNPELEVIEEVAGFRRGLGSLCLSTQHGALYSLKGLNHSDTSDTGSLICLDLATLETRWEHKTRASGMVSLALNGDQSRLAILVDGDQILLLQPEDGTLLETLAQPSQGGTTEDLLRVAFGPGPDRLVATSTQGAVHFWDLNRRVPTLHLDAHERYATALAVAGDRVITGGSDRQISVWHHSTASELATRADRARKELEDAGRTPLHPPGRDEHIDWLWQAAASGDDRQVKAASTLHYSFSRRIGTAPHDPELLASGAALSLCWRTQRVHLETATRNLAWGLERMDPASPNRLRTAMRLCAAHVRLGRPWHAVGVGARETFRTVLRTLLFGAAQSSPRR